MMPQEFPDRRSNHRGSDGAAPAGLLFKSVAVRVRALVCLLAMCALVSAGCVREQSQDGSQPAKVQIEVAGNPAGNTRLRTGLTHTQFSADAHNEPSSVASSRGLLSKRPVFQNQHIMGWGALNPQPVPGTYNWASLDSRIELIRQTSGTPVITLCCAPDWMKGGRPGQTDWSMLNRAPSPDHYADFAAMAGDIARRYPDVKHFQVWHGLKGFFDKKRGRWDYEGYTHLYNLVYRQLKAVSPDIKVGGPHVTIDSWSEASGMSKPSKVRGSWGVVDQRALDVISYWLAGKEGADFITLDMSLPNKDGVSPAGPFEAAHKIGAVAEWVRSRTDLPLWAARWNPFPRAAADWSQDRQSAVLATAFIELARFNVEVGLLWEPQARGSLCTGCLWTDTRMPGGGQPTPAYAALDSLAQNFPPDTPLMSSQTSWRSVAAISSPAVTALVNQLGRPQQVEVNGAQHRLRPYEVLVLPRG